MGLGQRSKPLNDAHSKNLRNNAPDAVEKHVHSRIQRALPLHRLLQDIGPAFCTGEPRSRIIDAGELEAIDPFYRNCAEFYEVN